MHGALSRHLVEVLQLALLARLCPSQPLNILHTQQLVKDTLHVCSEQSQALAELIFKKTQGNPFFITQVLKSLHQENLLFFKLDIPLSYKCNGDEANIVRVLENMNK